MTGVSEKSIKLGHIRIMAGGVAKKAKLNIKMQRASLHVCQEINGDLELYYN